MLYYFLAFLMQNHHQTTIIGTKQLSHIMTLVSFSHNLSWSQHYNHTYTG